MSTDATICTICNGTGIDEAFGSECICQDQELDTSSYEVSESRLATEDEQDQLIKFLVSLAGDEFADSLVSQYATRGLSDKQWAAAKRMQTQHQQQTSQGEYRFSKIGETWVVYGPTGTQGEQVTVVKANGETKQAWLGELQASKVRGMDAYEVQWDSPTATQAQAEIEPGFYTNAQDQVFKVQRSATGNLYAKQLDDDSGKFEYVGRAPLSTGLVPLTLEQASEWGRRTGSCMICGRELTNADSIERGIGPICAAKL